MDSLVVYIKSILCMRNENCAKIGAARLKIRQIFDRKSHFVQARKKT